MQYEPVITAAVDLPADGSAPDLSTLPAVPGVLILESSRRETAFLGVSADIRAMARRRLAPAPSEDASPRPDHRAVAARALAAPAGCPLEADAAFLSLSRARTPTLHRAVVERWRAWFVHVNPDTAFPRFTKRPLPASPGGDSKAPPTTGLLLGPFGDKHAAQRYIEILQDAFDLCRYHHILVQAPDATACAYKDMGRCPAPCDGSESMDAYRERLREAAMLDPESRAAFTEQLEAEMRAASEDLDFERAEGCKRRLERFDELRAAKHAHARPVEDFGCLIVGRSENTDHARLLLARRGSLIALCDVSLDAPKETLRAILESAAACAESAPPFSGAAHECETIGLVSAHLFAGGRRAAKQTFLPLPGRPSGAPDAPALRRAIRRIAGDEDKDTGAFAEREFEVDEPPHPAGPTEA